LYEMGRKHLLPFTVQCVPGRNGEQYKPAGFHADIAKALTEVERGRIKRLAISMPPQHGKSTLANISFPAWYMGRHPTHYVISSSYGYSLSQGFSRKTRDVVTSPSYANIFPDVKIATGQGALDEWALSAGGVYHVAGYKGGHSGHPCNLFIFDDPYSDWHDARSRATQERVNQFYDSTLLPRMSTAGAIVLIHTRWGQTDLIGRVADSSWTVLRFPAQNSDGAYLWHEYYTNEHYEAIKLRQGASMWNALYQQNPTPAEGNIFKRDGWGQYNGDRPAFKRVIQSWDTAFKQGEENDFSVCCTFGDTATDVWLLDVYRKRITYPELVAMAKQKAEQYHPNAVLIEDKASGQSLIQSLRAETRLPIIPIKTDTDKVSRATAITGYVEAGRVKLPGQAAWLPDFMAEVLAFPNGEHDDQVDALSQGANYLLSRRGVLQFA
jgi:predicted phage terminase large subunit-like protein